MLLDVGMEVDEGCDFPMSVNDAAEGEAPTIFAEDDMDGIIVQEVAGFFDLFIMEDDPQEGQVQGEGDQEEGVLEDEVEDGALFSCPLDALADELDNPDIIVFDRDRFNDERGEADGTNNSNISEFLLERELSYPSQAMQPENSNAGENVTNPTPGSSGGCGSNGGQRNPLKRQLSPDTDAASKNPRMAEECSDSSSDTDATMATSSSSMM